MKKSGEAFFVSFIFVIISVCMMYSISMGDFVEMEGDIGIAAAITVTGMYLLNALNVKKEKLFKALAVTVTLIIVGIIFGNNSDYMNVEGKLSIAFAIVSIGSYVIEAIEEK